MICIQIEAVHSKPYTHGYILAYRSLRWSYQCGGKIPPVGVGCVLWGVGVVGYDYRVRSFGKLDCLELLTSLKLLYTHLKYVTLF